MKFTKVITHPFTHHADEVLAIETIFHFLGERLPIERKLVKDISEDEINDPSVIILDITGVLDTERSIFDHHQDKNSPATNILVLNHLSKDKKLNNLLIKHLFGYVSAVDRGDVVERDGDDFNIPSFNATIRNLNNVEDGFNKALEVARIALSGAIETAKQAIEGEAIWDSLPKIGKIAHDKKGSFIVGWKALAERDGILILSSPNARGGWQLTSRDTDVFVIPEHPTQTFRHNSGFLAVYASFEDAEDHIDLFFN